MRFWYKFAVTFGNGNAPQIEVEMINNLLSDKINWVLSREINLDDIDSKYEFKTN